MINTNNMNLEIYEFIINGYPKSGLSHPSTNFYTTKIESVNKDNCGYISDEESPYTKRAIIDTKRRSCDLIDGTIKNLITTISDAGPLELSILDNDHSIFFDLDGITSMDLIKFSHIFLTKEKIKYKHTIVIICDEIPNMTKIYEHSFITKILSNMYQILKNDWVDVADTLTKTYIKVLRPTIEDEYVVLGDLHGSFATFMRILLRLRKMNYFNEMCEFQENKHIIFLGDIVDRGTYGYEILMLIFLLKIKNPNNVHINNGNHEEITMNENYGFQNDMTVLFGDIKCWEEINNTLKFNHSALLIENPNIKGNYTYLSHGGLPINCIYSKHAGYNFELSPFFTKEAIDTTEKIFINNRFISVPSARTSIVNGNTIRWGDYHGKRETIFGNRGCIIGTDIIDRARDVLGIGLIIRGHQDSYFNTKLIKYDAIYGQMIDINELSPSNINKCYGYTHLIKNINYYLNINNVDIDDILPVVTISTNTDTGRDLNRDSFAILKFIEIFNPEIQGCVEEKSEEDIRISENIKRTLGITTSHVFNADAAPAPPDDDSSDDDAPPFPVPGVVNSHGDISKKLSDGADWGDFVGGEQMKHKYLKYKAKYLQLKRQFTYVN